MSPVSPHRGATRRQIPPVRRGNVRMQPKIGSPLRERAAPRPASAPVTPHRGATRPWIHALPSHRLHPRLRKQVFPRHRGVCGAEIAPVRPRKPLPRSWGRKETDRQRRNPPGAPESDRACDEPPRAWIIGPRSSGGGRETRNPSPPDHGRLGGWIGREWRRSMTDRELKPGSTDAAASSQVQPPLGRRVRDRRRLCRPDHDVSTTTTPPVSRGTTRRRPRLSHRGRHQDGRRG